MKIKIIGEYGVEQALLGLGLSKGLTSNIGFDGLCILAHYSAELLDRLYNLALKLAPKDGGHNKFLESIVVWLDIAAPRYFWQQFDTYRCGVSKQSESTMHTLTKRQLSQADFSRPIHPLTIERLNDLIKEKDLEQLKAELPESFLQRRIVATNYKTLRHIIAQRRSHRLVEWRVFCEAMRKLEHFEFAEDLY